MNPAVTVSPRPLAAPPTSTPRIASVDALRGWVIALMIFVNDIAGAAHAPSWLKHVDAKADAMTLPDIVFPAFLFIAGMSIPLAFSPALAHGATTKQLLLKIAGRTFALLAMGVLMVNLDAHNPWPRGAWGVLTFTAMLLAFVVVPRESSQARRFWRVARTVGAIALAALALSYTNAAGQHLVFGPLFDPSDPVWLRHSWWGILGLIGWVYLAASLVYLACRRRREALVAAVGILTALFIAGHSDMANRLAAREWLDPVRPVLAPLEAVIGWLGSHVSVAQVFGSLAAIAVAGCCLGTILLPASEIKTPASRLRWAGWFVAGLLLAAVLLDPLYGINKIRATPTWCLLCAAIAASGWMLLYWRMDIRGGGGWNRIVQPAGANPLLAYLLHPFVYLVAKLVGVPLGFYKATTMPLALSIGGSLLMTFLVVQLTGAIAKTGYRLKV